MTTIFRSHHTQYLENLIEEMKKSHADQMKYVIEDNQRLRAELERTRLLLTPALKEVDRYEGPDNSPPPSLVFDIEKHGTPWQRVQAREARLQREADAEEERKRKEAVAASGVNLKGDNDGNVRQQGESAPLSQ
jgi:hypothetical protein